MTSEQTLLIEHACRRLSLAFAHLNDTQAYEALANLFTEDGVFYRPLAPDAAVAGRASILKDMQKKPADLLTHHVCTNIVVDVLCADSARGLTYFTVYLQPGYDRRRALPPFTGTVYVGIYEDQFLRTADGWKISERRGRNLFLLPAASAARMPGPKEGVTAEVTDGFPSSFRS